MCELKHRLATEQIRSAFAQLEDLKKVIISKFKVVNEEIRSFDSSRGIGAMRYIPEFVSRTKIELPVPDSIVKAIIDDVLKFISGKIRCCRSL
jgi:hypothetical protein